MDNICQKIGELSAKENVDISLEFAPNHQLFIEVFDSAYIYKHDCLIVCWDWSDESIIQSIIDIIRRVKEA